MKTSRRLLLGTFLALLAAPVVLVAYSRISGGSTRELPLPERTAPAAVAALRDFTAIEVEGDFDLEVISAPGYSIEYAPLAERRGEFVARVEDGTLVIRGYGNRRETTAATLRIGLPELTRLDGQFLFRVAVRNFDSESLDMRLVAIREVSIENNRIGSLRLEIPGTENLEFNGNTIDNSRVRTFGTTIMTD